MSLAVGIWSIHLPSSFFVTYLGPDSVSALDKMSTIFYESGKQIWSLASRLPIWKIHNSLIVIFVICKTTNLFIYIYFFKQDNIAVTLCSFITLCPPTPAALQPALDKWNGADKGKQRVSTFSKRFVAELCTCVTFSKPRLQLLSWFFSWLHHLSLIFIWDKIN